MNIENMLGIINSVDSEERKNITSNRFFNMTIPGDNQQQMVNTPSGVTFVPKGTDASKTELPTTIQKKPSYETDVNYDMVPGSDVKNVEKAKIFLDRTSPIIPQKSYIDKDVTDEKIKQYSTTAATHAQSWIAGAARDWLWYADDDIIGTIDYLLAKNGIFDKQTRGEYGITREDYVKEWRDKLEKIREAHPEESFSGSATANIVQALLSFGTAPAIRGTGSIKEVAKKAPKLNVLRNKAVDILKKYKMPVVTGAVTGGLSADTSEKDVIALSALSGAALGTTFHTALSGLLPVVTRLTGKSASVINANTQKIANKLQGYSDELAAKAAGVPNIKGKWNKQYPHIDPAENLAEFGRILKKDVGDKKWHKIMNEAKDGYQNIRTRVVTALANDKDMLKRIDINREWYGKAKDALLSELDRKGIQPVDIDPFIRKQWALLKDISKKPRYSGGSLKTQVRNLERELYQLSHEVQKYADGMSFGQLRKYMTELGKTVYKNGEVRGGMELVAQLWQSLRNEVRQSVASASSNKVVGNKLLSTLTEIDHSYEYFEYLSKAIHKLREKNIKKKGSLVERFLIGGGFFYSTQTQNPVSTTLTMASLAGLYKFNQKYGMQVRSGMTGTAAKLIKNIGKAVDDGILPRSTLEKLKSAYAKDVMSFVGIHNQMYRDDSIYRKFIADVEQSSREKKRKEKVNRIKNIISTGGL